MNQFKKMIGKVKSGCLKASCAVVRRLDAIEEDVRGMGTIEMVLLVAILVALALLFKGFIDTYASNIFGKIEEKTDDAFLNW